jgi:hypothetical protein
MLERLLDLVQSGETRHIDGLARELDTTPELVYAMLEDLIRMGYLKAVDGVCETQCGSCSLACECGAGANGRVWTVTERRNRKREHV